MTKDKARKQWESQNPEGDWDALTEEEQKDILTEAVKAERSSRRR